MNGITYSANFLIDGSWMETEYEIKESEIPSAILSELELQFEGYEIEEAEISETAIGRFYQLELEKGEEKIEVKFDEKGVFISKKAVSDED